MYTNIYLSSYKHVFVYYRTNLFIKYKTLSSDKDVTIINTDNFSGPIEFHLARELLMHILGAF